MVPSDWPVMVCVLLATGVMVTPVQGLVGAGAGAGVVSLLEHPEIRPSKNKAGRRWFLCIVQFTKK